MPNLYSSLRFTLDGQAAVNVEKGFSKGNPSVVPLTASDQGNELPFCDVNASYYVAGAWDGVRGHLQSKILHRLHESVEQVHALVCTLSDESYYVILSPAEGPTLLLPREGSLTPRAIRVRAPSASQQGASILVVHHGTNAYLALKEAAAVLADKTGLTDDEAHFYVLPMLDCINRMTQSSAVSGLLSCTGSGALARQGDPTDGRMVTSSSFAALPSPGLWETAQVQQLVGNISVQAGPCCPPKPLLQAPVLRVCEGMTAPLGIRYSGMSLVYGFASDCVLSIMDSAAAMRMVPRAAGSAAMSRCGSAGGVSGLQPSASVPVPGCAALHAVSSSPCLSASGAPLGSTASVPVPQSHPLSRSGSGQGLAAAPSMGSLAGSGAATPVGGAPLAAAGRSMTAAPLIQVLAAGPTRRGGGSSSTSSTADGSSSTNTDGLPAGEAHLAEYDSDDGAVVGVAAATAATATGVDVAVLANLAVVGVRGSGTSSVGTVRSCRIMPAASLQHAVGGSLPNLHAAQSGPEAPPEPGTDCASPVGAPGRAAKGLGVMLELEVELAAGAPGGTLLLFAEVQDAARPARHARTPVRRVEVVARGGLAAVAALHRASAKGAGGLPASQQWRYDAADCMLRVELGARGEAGPRLVRVYL